MTKEQTIQAKSEPRLTPIENPQSLKLKLAYWYTERMIGKVLTPLKVHYARFPEGLGLSRKIMQTEQKCTLEPKLKHLIKVYIATLNGCAFCVDIGKANAQKEDMNPEVFDDLLRFEESDRFSKAEKAMLSYIDEVTRNKHVADATFERLQEYFNERSIVQITLLNAIENFYNLMNAPMNIGSDELCELMNGN
ncbi:carboxymuconolactone decarboxylase family protein [Aliifodinibius salicampi]|uniref:Carboxymuconolactone decarboxylase family protein n=2 Tax=Fodinibius salicampi TaxID=1920655 RepID=A0ABT3Q1D1_9BACT|nr:carboxymuconolactone decarboxylase family protein [Fodinibius salicampi]